MKRPAIPLATLTLGLLLTRTARAAPVAPELQVSLTPPEGAVEPGQLVLIFVSGGYPLEVQGTLDDQPVAFYWNGDGYVGLVPFDLETPPGTHSIAVHAAEPGSARTVDYQATVTVGQDPYPKQAVNIPGALASLLDPALNQAELDRLATIVAPATRHSDWSWPFAFPAVSRITALYGQDRTYNRNQLHARHTGIDFRMPEGAQVFAAAPGQVVAADAFDIRGNVVIINHGWGVYTLYAHLSSIQVAAGDVVAQGQLIGEAGRTGRSTGTHLHWEVIVNGVEVDPLFWMALSPRYIQPAIEEAASEATS